MGEFSAGQWVWHTPRHASVEAFAVLASEHFCRQLMKACAGTALQCVRLMQALDTETVKDYLAERKELAAHVGPSNTKSDWQVGPLHPPSPLPPSLPIGPFHTSPCLHASRGSPSLQMAHVAQISL